MPPRFYQSTWLFLIWLENVLKLFKTVLKLSENLRQSTASDHLPEFSYSIDFDHSSIWYKQIQISLIKEIFFNKYKKVHVRQNQFISIKAIRLKHFIVFHCACCYGNIESVKECIWVEIVPAF